jgi:hypothetical protein
MRVRALSPTGDYTFGASQLNFLVDSSAAVAQLVKTALLLWLGEWSYDISQGMPWFEDVIGKHSQATADLAIQNYILGIQGVTDITQFQSAVNAEGRTYVVTLFIQTQFSETPVQVFDAADF